MDNQEVLKHLAITNAILAMILGILADESKDQDTKTMVVELMDMIAKM